MIQCDTMLHCMYCFKRCLCAKSKTTFGLADIIAVNLRWSHSVREHDRCC